jgi:hypothetical protein
MSKARSKLLDEIEKVLEHPGLPEADRLFVQRCLELGSPKDAALQMGDGSDGIMRLARIKRRYMPADWQAERATLRRQSADKDEHLRRQLQRTIEDAIRRSRAILDELGKPSAIRKTPAMGRASLLRAAMVSAREGERLLRNLRAPGSVGTGSGPKIAVTFAANPEKCPNCGHSLKADLDSKVARLMSGGRMIEDGEEKPSN